MDLAVRRITGSRKVYSFTPRRPPHSAQTRRSVESLLRMSASGSQRLPNRTARGADIVWSFVDGHGRTVALVLSAVYFFLAGGAARSRMLWGDKLYTLYVARLGDWERINRLLA